MATTTGPSTAARSSARVTVSHTAASRRVQRRSSGASPSNQQTPLSRWVVQARSRPMKVGMARHPSTGAGRMARSCTGGPMAELIEALTKRRARRAFDPREVPGDAQELLWRAVSVAPSHGNVQSVRLLVAQAEAVRGRVVAALSEGNRNWAPAAPLLVALGSLPEHEHADSYGAQRALWSFHAGIAAGNLMAQATALGLVAHPMAGFDEGAVRVAFGGAGGAAHPGRVRDRVSGRARVAAGGPAAAGGARAAPPAA